MKTLTLKLINPYNQEILHEMPYETQHHLDEKLTQARKAFEVWRRVPLTARVQEVWEGLKRFRANTEEVAREVTLQMGKPIREARQEVKTCCDRAEHMLSIAVSCLTHDVLPPVPGFYRRIEHEPLGVVLNIAAWNYPLLIPVNVIVPALLAGNTVLLKHSGRTPLCGLQFERAFGGLMPPGLVTNVILSHEQTALLIGDPRINHVAFTGSVPGGRDIYREASRRFIDVGLELGGKDPAYVAADANLDFAVENIVDGACYNAGQSCCAVERVYVHQRIYNDFLTRAQAVMERYRLGNPLAEETTMGPLANRSALDILEGQVENGLTLGARLIMGGHPLTSEKGNFFPPTLMADVHNDATAMQEESFGPLLPVLSVESDEQALLLMDETRYGLTASVWTQDRERAERFARELEAGTIYQNRCDYLDPALPWTGVRDSGKGSTLSRFGFLPFTRHKSIHFRD
jgi:acyl-CoA reductase-like NAD-dependent aldehyde dehydrogenase